MAGAFGAPLILGTLAEITAAAATSSVGVFKLSLDNFPDLQADYGSLVLQVPGMAASFPPIVVTRLPNNQFAAVSSRCTHQGCTVDPYSASYSAIVCQCHGSEYKPTGEVIRGPAPLPLPKYMALFDGTSQVSIQIPGLGYSVAISTVSQSPRLELSFPSTNGLTYQVQSRPNVGAAWAPVHFSLTPAGALDQTSIAGAGTPVTVYVDKPGNAALFAISGS